MRLTARVLASAHTEMVHEARLWCLCHFTKEITMRTKLTLLAVLASASLMAQAQTTPAMTGSPTASNIQSVPSGNEPLNKAPTTTTASGTTRAAVRSEAVDAAHTGTISKGTQPLGPMVSPHSTTTRAATRAEGSAAAESGQIATGNKPQVGAPGQRTGAAAERHGNATGSAKDAPSGNEPYAKAPSTYSATSRSDTRAEARANGGTAAVKSGNQPLAPQVSATSAASRADVRVDAKVAVHNGAIRTGNAPAPQQ